MNSRERVKTIIGGEAPDRCGFWLGDPHEDMWPILHNYFGTTNDENLRLKLNDDYRWLCPWDAYKHPEGKPVFDYNRGKALDSEGAFANCDSVQEIHDYYWPDPDYLDFEEFISTLKNTGNYYRASGFWCHFFHETSYFFGMENYFIKMYTEPEIVHAVTRHIVDFYLEANKRLFETAGDEIDGFFFGNDFGSQQNLLISPELMDEFVFPYFKELVDQAKSYGYQVILHSCGAIHKIIPKLIEMKIDALHPLQAKSINMDALTLAENFKGQIAFIGGIDTQDLLVKATPDEIRTEVRRVKKILGPRLLVSSSHEALLPNIPPENVAAMAESAIE